MVTFGQVKEREFALIDVGEYVLTLDDMEESVGNWGDRLIWKFLVAPKETPTEYISLRDDGRPESIWVFTDQDIILGSQCHELVEKLSGRTLDEGDDPPSVDDLLGKRVLGYVTHHTPKQGKNAGKKQAQIVAGSIKPYRLPGERDRGRPDPTQVSADPSSEDVDRALLISSLERAITKLGRLDTVAGREAENAKKDSDLGTADVGEIQRLLDDVNAAVTRALEE